MHWWSVPLVCLLMIAPAWAGTPEPLDQVESQLSPYVTPGHTPLNPDHIEYREGCGWTREIKRAGWSEPRYEAALPQPGLTTYEADDCGRLMWDQGKRQITLDIYEEDFWYQDSGNSFWHTGFGFVGLGPAFDEDWVDYRAGNCTEENGIVECLSERSYECCGEGGSTYWTRAWLDIATGDFVIHEHEQFSWLWEGSGVWVRQHSGQAQPIDWVAWLEEGGTDSVVESPLGYADDSTDGLASGAIDYGEWTVDGIVEHGPEYPCWRMENNPFLPSYDEECYSAMALLR